MSEMIDFSKPTRDVINEIMKASREDRHRVITDWVHNMRALAGFTEDDVYSSVDPPNAAANAPEPRDARYVTSFNLSRSFYQRLLGRLTRVITNFQVLASSLDKDDRDAAKVGARLLKTRTAEDNGQDYEAIARATSYLFAGGPAYLLIEPHKEFGSEDEDVLIEPVLPFDVYICPGALNLNDSPAIVLVQRLSKQEIQVRWPEFSELLDFGILEGAKWPEDVRFSGIASEMKKCRYEVRRLFIRPCKDFPGGVQRTIIVGNDELEDKKEIITGEAKWEEVLGSPDKRYPLEELSDVPMGPFYEDRGRMTISQKMQRVMDICISKSIDLTVGAPQVILPLPRGSGLNQDDITDQAFVTVPVTPGMKIEPVQMPGLGSLKEMIDFCIQTMSEVHAQHPPSRGQIPGTRTSGKALQTAIDMDEFMDSPIVGMIRRSMGRVGKRILMVGQRIWSDEHIFNVAGKFRQYETLTFKKADLKRGYDVRVLPAQGLPRNKAAAMQLVEKGLAQGLFNDTPEGRRARELLNIQTDDDFFEIEQAEKQLIGREEAAIAQGQQVPINWSDDHSLHVPAHKRHNTERLALGNTEGEGVAPEMIGQLALAHVQQHEQQMAAAQQQQLEQQLLLAGKHTSQIEASKKEPKDAKRKTRS